MKRQLLLIIGISFLWFCQGCDEEDKAGSGTKDEVLFSAKITNLLTGKTEDRFDGGSAVGISMVQYDAAGNPGVLSDDNNYATNVKYRQSAAGLSGDQPIMWGNIGKADIYAYHPWRADITPVSAYSFEISGRQDQLQAGLPGYTYNDFLWAKTTSNAYVSPVNLEFRHLMSQIIVHVKNGEGGTELLEGSEICILGHNVAGVIDLTKGEVKAISPVVVKDIVSEGTDPKEGFEVSGRAVTIPQVIPAGTLMLQVISPNGNKYKYVLPESLEFIAGGSREITMTVLPGGPVEVTIGEVTAWREDQAPVNGSASYYRVYKVGDEYSRNGVDGMVYKVDETGEHGMIVSLEQEYSLAWSTENVLTEATSMDDGYANMEAIRKIDTTFSKYPAFEWCETTLNKDDVTGWYLPSANELKELYLVMIVDPYYDKGWFEWTFPLNDKLEDMGGNRLYGIYYSSTQVAMSAVRAFEISPYLDNDYTSKIPPKIFWQEHSQYSKNDGTKVRAIRKF